MFNFSSEMWVLLIVLAFCAGYNWRHYRKKHPPEVKPEKPSRQASVCGHVLQEKIISLATREKPMLFPEGEKALYCADCIALGAIICPSCKCDIFPGDKVSVHYAHDGKFPEGACVFRESFFFSCASSPCQNGSVTSAPLFIDSDGIQYPGETEWRDLVTA